jgi:formate hydrogenlyase transcriptional activator
LNSEDPRVGQYRALLEVSESIALNHDLDELFRDLSDRLGTVVRFDYLALLLYDPEREVTTRRVLETRHIVDPPAGEMPASDSPAGWVTRTQQPWVAMDLESKTDFPQVVGMLRTNGIRCACLLPLTTAQRRLGALGFGRSEPHAYSDADLEFMTHAARLVAVAVDNALNYERIAELSRKLEEEKLYLEDEIRTEFNFEEIVGDSAALKRILRQTETVAPTDATVLILGETGTGKELIARAIHQLSRRRERTFVKVNCAAIPTGLLESELFGHEKGAFTGAIERKIGRFELAHGGTLFLDEVGDIPSELQPKLLRALQEHEFERLGSTRTIRVDARLIAATNRDLPVMVAEGEFRADLFYRLNVFPVTIPPLRERREDIPTLVRYFAQRFARRMNKPIETIPAEVMDALTEYAWPGNVRELENLLERAVILSRGSALAVPVSELRRSAGAVRAETLESAEREHILRALEASGWVLAGPKGAAAKLGLKRTTLQSKMARLGIRKPRT